MFRCTKPLADLLTVSRVLLGVCLVGLGMARGAEVLPTAVLAVIVSWLTDLLDGPLACHDPDHRSTWVGEHDTEADLTVSLGVAAYLVLSGYLAGWLGAVLVLTILVLWVLHSVEEGAKDRKQSQARLLPHGVIRIEPRAQALFCPARIGNLAHRPYPAYNVLKCAKYTRSGGEVKDGGEGGAQFLLIHITARLSLYML